MTIELSAHQKAVMDRNVEKVQYFYPEGDQIVLCVLTMKGHGHQVVGKAGCVNPVNFKREIGEGYALADALSEIGKFLGFLKRIELVESQVIEHE